MNRVIWSKIGLISIILLGLSIFLGYVYQLKNSAEVIEVIEETSR